MTTETTALQVQQPAGVFASIANFEDYQRMAKVFVNSNLVPANFKGDMGACLIALNMANRMGADPLQVMQSLYVVHGKPSFSSAFLIACFNQCGRYTAIRYREVGERGTDTWGCQAITTEKSTGEVLEGVTVTIGMAKAEGWYNKTGSKWKTMPELMMRYRAATFLIRSVAPEIALGFQTTEEVRDITDQATIVSSEPKMSLEDIAMQAIEEQPRENEEKKAAAPVAEEPKEAEPQPTPQEEPNGTIDFKDEPKPRKVPTAKHYTI